MTNEELDKARADEAKRLFGAGHPDLVAQLAASLAREGWTPPEPVDPDLLLARKIEAGRLGVPPTVSNAILRGAHDGDIEIERTVETIKRGRELERAEAKPGMVWVKHDYSSVPPRLGPGAKVATICDGGHFNATSVGAIRDWTTIEYYMWIEWPEDYEQ